MELPINKDPQELNKSVFSGRKYWQWICIALAGAIAVVFTLLFSEKLGATLTGIITSVLVIPLGYVGVFKKNNLDFFEYYKEKKKNALKQNTYLYVSDIPSQKDLYINGKQSKKRKGTKDAIKIMPTITDDTVIEGVDDIKEGGNENG
jgi:hypothetical protein